MRAWVCVCVFLLCQGRLTNQLQDADNIKSHLLVKGSVVTGVF